MATWRTSPPLEVEGRPAFSRRTRSAFTIVEILVAMAIALTFLSALYSSMMQLLRASDEARARVEAMRNGRSALLTLTDEFKAISRSGADFLVLGINNDSSFGDGIDNDDDGTVDEETIDGRDEDSDYLAVNDDRHAPISTVGVFDFFERQDFVLEDDLGDVNVDEDVVFGNDTLDFQLFPPAIDAALTSATISYALGSVDGQSNVLLRTAKIEDGGGSTTSVSPLAFGVLGLDFLYWDPNKTPGALLRDDRPYWVTDWDSNDAGSFDPPQLELPASIYVRLTLYADRRPITSYQPGAAVNTLRVDTVVNLEDIIGDAAYPRLFIP
jgi:type II secretory pathway pseudopilin PulG